MKYQAIATKLNNELKKSQSVSETMEIILHLADSLKKNNSEELLLDILKEAHEISKADISEIAYVETPIKLTTEQKHTLQDKLTKLFKKEILIKERLNKEIAGGIKIYYQDDLIDLSWNNQINIVAQTIKHND